MELGLLWRYRDLCRMYIHRNIVISYRQTILGPLWFIIQPLIAIGIFMFIFGGIAGISTEGIPQPLFYMAGILLWNYFSECFNSTSNFLLFNANVFKMVYFPRLVVPIATAFSALGKSLVQFGLFLFIYIWCLGSISSLSVNWSIILLPVYFLLLALLGISMGLIISALTYKYRDLQIIINYLLQFLMYATPVVYPLEAMPEKYRFIIQLNPLTSIFESFKYGWFNTGSLDWEGLLYSTMFLIVVGFISLLIINRVSQKFVDTV